MMKKVMLLTLLLLAVNIGSAQTKIKIDGVAVVVGENIVLESDIDKFRQEMESQSDGKIDLSNCEMLEEIMTQKLLAHHAVVDSIEVSDAEVEAGVNRNISYFKQQLGSIDKVVELYGFDDEIDLRKELKKIEKEGILIRGEKKKILENVEVTPEEVRVYFKSLEEESNLPEFGTEIELAQITIHVEPTEEEVDETIKKLQKIRSDVMNGSSMRMKAVLYSDDPAVTNNGGKYTITRESGFVKEFKEVAFSLDEGEVSEPFKTQFGYHVIQLEKIKGQEIDVRHVLVSPKVSKSRLRDTETKVKAIRDSILAGDLSFADAVLRYSDDVDTKQNKGIIINPQTNDSRFELTRMAPEFYSRVNNLNKGDICEPYYDETRDGKKMFKMILMKDKVDGHKADFVKDYVKIQELTLQKKQAETLENWNKEHVLDTYIKIDEGHQTCSFKYNWAKEE